MKIYLTRGISFFMNSCFKYLVKYIYTRLYSVKTNLWVSILGSVWKLLVSFLAKTLPVTSCK